MAGPSSAVLLSFIPSETDLADIQNIIQRVSTTVQGEDFWVATTIPMGGALKINKAIEARPFILALEELKAGEFYSASELSQIESFSHTKPVFSLTLAAMCNGQVDQRILGELTLYIAIKLNGVIYFDGSLELQEIAGYQGKVCDIDTEEAEAAYSICDTEFMKWWLDSPNFKMIK
jgi:hypothetical protein